MEPTLKKLDGHKEVLCRAPSSLQLAPTLVMEIGTSGTRHCTHEPLGQWEERVRLGLVESLVLEKPAGGNTNEMKSRKGPLQRVKFLKTREGLMVGESCF